MGQALVLKMFIKENDNILMHKNDYLIFDEYNLDVWHSLSQKHNHFIIATSAI